MYFIDLKTQLAEVREKINVKIKDVLDSGVYLDGTTVTEIENKLSSYIGVKYAVEVGSGTDALLIPLIAFNVGPGDAVFTTSFSFISTAMVIGILRATPVFVDIDEKTFNIDPSHLEDEIKKVVKEGKLKPRGIIPVDLFGQSADYDKINYLAEKHELFVLADSAQSFGASYKGRKSCSLTSVGATSFFPEKPLGCYGNGGMIFTDDKDLYEQIVSVKVYGCNEDDKFDNIRLD